ncbi:MAG: UbiA family prenyltransferase [Verrucomicrobiales bacterium]
MLEYLKACRIDHWLKNVFIVFGHASAVVLVPAVKLNAATLAVAAFSLVPACLIASANYILNEILDAPYDRLHPTKKDRGVPSGRVKVPILWILMVALILAGFGLSLRFLPIGYSLALTLLLLSGLVYNVPPVRLKDRAFLDVIAESFNNPIRLWLGWYALVPALGVLPPLSIVMAWWAFGGLLMTGKRYSEFRFINDAILSGHYRKSFRAYSEQRLLLAMITYASLFCFGTGVAIGTYPRLHNLVFVFPMLLVAILAYFRRAISEVGARLEPEQLLQNKWIIASAVATAALAAWLLTTDLPLLEWSGFLRPVGF